MVPCLPIWLILKYSEEEVIYYAMFSLDIRWNNAWINSGLNKYNKLKHILGKIEVLSVNDSRNADPGEGET